MTYAENIASGGGATNGAADPTLDRSYEYDNVGRLVISHAGAEARAHAYSGQWGTMDGPYSQGYDFDVWGNVTHKYGWGGEVQGGGAGQSSDIYYTYTNNRRNNSGFTYDAAGNVTAGNVTMNTVSQTFTYDATGQQATATYGASWLQQWYDGDGLRVKKNDNGAVTYYLRSSVLGGQVIAELNGSATWMRGYVYLGSQLLAVQDSGVYWMHEDPVTKSKRVTNSAGAIVSTIELDPWGADTNRSINSAFQPKKFTSYERDGNGTDEAMFRRYNRWMSRFDQPDPYDGSYDYSNPQSFNRYAYVQGDPVNFVDPSGLLPILVCGYSWVNGEVGYMYSCGIREVPEIFPSPEPREPPEGKEPEDQAEKRKDCYDFANKVEEISDSIFKNNQNPANNYFPHNVNSFMDALARTFTELESATEVALATRYLAGSGNRTDYGTEGFAPPFIDTQQGSDNQARHATFGFVIGYAGPLLRNVFRGDIRSPLEVANGREDLTTRSGRADTRLNNLTVPMGENLAGATGQQFAKQLADWIRKNICAPR